MSLESSNSQSTQPIDSQPSQTGAVLPDDNSQPSTAERYTKNIQNSSVDGLAPGADVKGIPILAAKPGLGPVPPPDGDVDMMRPTQPTQPGGSRRKKSKSSRVARKSRSTRRRKSSRRKSRTATATPHRNRRRTTRK